MTSIYLIRHCEAEGNLFRRAQGHWNGRVTERGYVQLAKLIERFSGVHLDTVYSSDLVRARTTAEALARPRGLPVHVTERLREVYMGVWEGKPWGQLQHDWPEQMNNFNNSPDKWHVPGGEGFTHVQKRLTGIIKEIAAENEGGTVAIASHGMAIKMFLMGVIGNCPGDPDNVGHGDNTSVSLLSVENGNIRVLYCNDNSHLDEETSTFARQRWWKQAALDPLNFYFVPLDPMDSADAELYKNCYSDTWTAAHGSSRGFVPSVYLSAARTHAKEDPAAIVKVMSGNCVAGLIELDPGRGVNDGCGWISLFYLRPEYRNKSLGAQLIGYASYYYESRGRKMLRLHAAITNEHAIGFYKHYGFREVRTERGVSSKQLLMEKTI